MGDDLNYYDGLANLTEVMRDGASLMEVVRVQRTISKLIKSTSHPDAARIVDELIFPLRLELFPTTMQDILQSGGSLLSGDIRFTSREKMFATVNLDRELLTEEAVTSDIILWKGAKWRIVTAPNIPRLHEASWLFEAVMRYVAKLIES